MSDDDSNTDQSRFPTCELEDFDFTKTYEIAMALSCRGEFTYYLTRRPGDAEQFQQFCADTLDNALGYATHIVGVYKATVTIDPTPITTFGEPDYKAAQARLVEEHEAHYKHMEAGAKSFITQMFGVDEDRIVSMFPGRESLVNEVVEGAKEILASEASKTDDDK